MVIRNDSFAKYLGVECRFWKIDESMYRLQTENKSNLPIEFKKYNEEELKNKAYIDIKKNEIESAYEIGTFCKYKDGVYYVENILDNKMVVLSPEIDTKKILGLHIYDDRRIEVEFNQFVSEVEEIWEERKAIEGFVFDAKPIFYIKEKNKAIE